MRGVKNPELSIPRACEVCGKLFLPRKRDSRVCPGKGACWRAAATKWHRSPEGRERLRLLGLVGALAKRARWDEKMLGDLLQAELPQTAEALLEMLKQSYRRGYNAGKMKARRESCQESIASPDAHASISTVASSESNDSSRPEGIRETLIGLQHDQIAYAKGRTT